MMQVVTSHVFMLTL